MTGLVLELNGIRTKTGLWDDEQNDAILFLNDAFTTSLINILSPETVAEGAELVHERHTESNQMC